MGDEVDKQNEMLDNIEKKVDRVNTKTENLNAKMKQVLEGVSPAFPLSNPCLNPLNFETWKVPADHQIHRRYQERSGSL